MLSQECQHHLRDAAAVVAKVVGDLQSGMITTQDLSILQGNIDVFMAVGKTLVSRKAKVEFNEDVIQKTVQLRAQEIARYKYVLGHVNNFVALCQHFTGMLY